MLGDRGTGGPVWEEALVCVRGYNGNNEGRNKYERYFKGRFEKTRLRSQVKGRFQMNCYVPVLGGPLDLPALH